MNSKNKIYTSLLAGTALLASQASAAIVVTQASAFPSSPDISVITPAQANLNDNVRLDANRRLTQTFQVTSGFKLDKFFIDVTGLLANQAFDVSIFTVADTNLGAPNAIPTGSNLLTTVTATTPGAISGGGSGVLEIDLTGSDEIDLATSVGTAGYAIQLNRVADNASTAPFVWVTHASGDGTSSGPVGPDLYTAGQAYGSVLGGGFTHGNSDFTLALVAVPEPSTGFLAAFAASALFLRRRRA